jgi:ABC-type branched-subunit amino acid transport system substrate-binding protein
VAAALLVLAAAVTIGACSGAKRQLGGRHKLDVKIGALVPLSGSQQAPGLAGQKAANLAVGQIRKAIGEVKADHTVTMLSENYRSEPAIAQELAGKLQKQGASCFVGPWTSGDAPAVVNEVAVRNKVLLITPAATADSLITLQMPNPGEINPYLTRTAAPDRLQGPALAQVVADSLGGAKKKKVSIGAYKSIYGNDLIKSFSAAWAKRGGKVSARVIYEPNLPDYRKPAQELVAPKPDAFVFFDFGETYTRLATELLKTHKWSPTKSFATDSLAISGFGQGGGAIVEGLRGVAPSAPRFGADAKAFNTLYQSGSRPNFRQPFDAQAFDAVVLCYLSAVAAGSNKGYRMARQVRAISAPPGKKYSWRQLPEAIRALEAGQDIDYQGASGPIDMDRLGNPTAAFYDVYRYENVRLATYGIVSVPPSAKGIQTYPIQFITPKIPGAPPPVTPGATGASGASGATGAKGKKSKRKTSKRKKRSGSGT